MARIFLGLRSRRNDGAMCMMLWRMSAGDASGHPIERSAPMMTPRLTAFAVAVFLLGAARAGEAPQPKWDIASLARIVQPMKHDMAGRLPLMLWNFPIPRNDQLVKM